MYIGVDFDGTIVVQGPYDATTPLVLMPGAREALQALKRAGHTLILWSARANLALRSDPYLDPLTRAGIRPFNKKLWVQAQPLHEARYQQMLRFVKKELPGVFSAVDDGRCGKIVADKFIDDRAIQFGTSMNGRVWDEIADAYGIRQNLQTVKAGG